MQELWVWLVESTTEGATAQLQRIAEIKRGWPIFGLLPLASERLFCLFVAARPSNGRYLRPCFLR